MANNPEIAWIRSAQKIGQLVSAGADTSKEHELRHQFFRMDEDVDLRKALESRGFQVSAREGRPGLDARRRDRLSALVLKPVVEELCRIADKYSAEYDGWELTGPLVEKR